MKLSQVLFGLAMSLIVQASVAGVPSASVPGPVSVCAAFGVSNESYFSVLLDSEAYKLGKQFGTGLISLTLDPVSVDNCHQKQIVATFSDRAAETYLVNFFAQSPAVVERVNR